MIFDPTVPVWGLVTLTISIASAIYALLSTRRKDIDERFKAGSERMDRHEARIAAAEQTISSMPGKEDIYELKIELAKMAGALDRVSANIEAQGTMMQRMDNVLTRHEDHLLDGGARR